MVSKESVLDSKQEVILTAKNNSTSLNSCISETDVISHPTSGIISPPKRITVPSQQNVSLVSSDELNLQQKNIAYHDTPTPVSKSTLNIQKRDSKSFSELNTKGETCLKGKASEKLPTAIENETSEKGKKMDGVLDVLGSKKDTDNESSRVGDKIKKFEKAAEDASSNTGRMSRPGSVRGRSRTERLGSDSKEDLPPPATPFRDNVHFDLPPVQIEKKVESKSTNDTTLEQQVNLMKNDSPNSKWQRNSLETEKLKKKSDSQKIIKPEFRPLTSVADMTIRSPSLGAKIPDQFPSHGTAFRNVISSPDTSRNNRDKFNEDLNTQNNFKSCKVKNKEKYSVSKGSSYFTRGSEEIWLVKKKDIEEIEERVLDSFRRAGGNICLKSDSIRPSSDSGQSVSFSHSTMGRNRRQMYTRSESLDPQWAGARSQTLKRQSSVACTCGHDKKTQRAKSSVPDTSSQIRPRSRSHGDENNQSQVLDKYETLV